MSSQDADTCLSILRETAAHARTVGGGPAEVPPWDVHALGIFSRAREQLYASSLLLERRLIGPAFALQRPLIEDSLMLAELASTDSRGRLSRIAAWRRLGLKKLEAFGRKALHLKIDDEPERIRGHLKEQRSQTDAALLRHGVAAQPFRRVDVACSEFDREEDYLFYEMSHLAVHGDDFVHALARSTASDGTMVVGFPALALGSSRGLCSPIRVPDHPGVPPTLSRIG